MSASRQEIKNLLILSQEFPRICFVVQRQRFDVDRDAFVFVSVSISPS